MKTLNRSMLWSVSLLAMVAVIAACNTTSKKRDSGGGQTTTVGTNQPVTTSPSTTIPSTVPVVGTGSGFPGLVDKSVTDCPADVAATTKAPYLGIYCNKGAGTTAAVLPALDSRGKALNQNTLSNCINQLSSSLPNLMTGRWSVEAFEVTQSSSLISGALSQFTQIAPYAVQDRTTAARIMIISGKDYGSALFGAQQYLTANPQGLYCFDMSSVGSVKAVSTCYNNNVLFLNGRTDLGNQVVQNYVQCH